jgi:GNAT superfamily N-acetyltransferase
MPRIYALLAEPFGDELTVIDAGLDTANHIAANLSAVKRIVIVVRDAAGDKTGRLIGGVLARTWGRCCEVQQIWVDATQRRQGIGRELMRRAEQEALARGCDLMYLETFSFQAPALYRACGFEVACQFEGFDDGIIKFVMRKRIGAA